MGEKYLTVKEIADVLKMTKPTVQKAINENCIEPDREEKNTRYYSKEKAVLIISLIRPDFDFSTFRQAENAENENQEIGDKDRQNRRKMAKNGENGPELMQAMIDMLKNQLKEKDKYIEAYEKQLNTYEKQMEMHKDQLETYKEQLKVKDQQIMDYSDRLKEALNLTRGQQYIAVADKTTKPAEEPEEAQTVSDPEPDQTQAEPQKTQKRGFWSRLFSR